MLFFGKPKVVIWPKKNNVEIFFDRKENNIFPFDLSLWDELDKNGLSTLSVFVSQNKISEVSVLVPDDIVVTKSFIYDSKITTIDKKEVIGLAESFVHFKIDPEAIEYTLSSDENKTIIKAKIFDQKKIEILKHNLSQVGVTKMSLSSVSSSLSGVFAYLNQAEYFLIYPAETNEYTLILAKGGDVYLTSNQKGPTLEIQKIINYSNLYFTSPTRKFYQPHNFTAEVVCTTQLDKTPFDDNQVNQIIKKPLNLPLPVSGLLIDNAPKSTDIINTSNNTDSMPTTAPTKPMEKNKKNILPIVAVFVVTAALVSFIVWYVVSRNNSNTDLENPGNSVPSDDMPSTSQMLPTEIPIPTLAEISKTIKIQVLNATDINGQAAVLKEQLTKLGFTSVAVGNSKETSSVNKIQVKADDKASASYFESALEGMFDSVEVSSDLKETSTYDVVFTIGVKLGSVSSSTETETLVATPTTKTNPTPTEEP